MNNTVRTGSGASYLKNQKQKIPVCQQKWPIGSSEHRAVSLRETRMKSSPLLSCCCEVEKEKWVPCCLRLLSARSSVDRGADLFTCPFCSKLHGGKGSHTSDTTVLCDTSLSVFNLFLIKMNSFSALKSMKSDRWRMVPSLLYYLPFCRGQMDCRGFQEAVKITTASIQALTHQNLPRKYLRVCSSLHYGHVFSPPFDLESHEIRPQNRERGPGGSAFQASVYKLGLP